MSQIDSNIYTGGNSITESQFKSLMDPTKLSAELKSMEGNEKDRPIKYAKPKYIEKIKKTYEVLEPVTNKTIVLPTKVSKKVREMKPVFISPVYVEGKDELNKALQDKQLIDNIADIPLPTASVISNLCKESVMQSNISEIQFSKFDSKIYQSKNEQQQIFQSKQPNMAQKSIKQSKDGQQLRDSDICIPVVGEGVGLKSSVQKDNIKNSTHDSTRKSNYNQSNISQNQS